MSFSVFKAALRFFMTFHSHNSAVFLFIYYLHLCSFTHKMMSQNLFSIFSKATNIHVVCDRQAVRFARSLNKNDGICWNNLTARVDDKEEKKKKRKNPHQRFVKCTANKRDIEWVRENDRGSNVDLVFTAWHSLNKQGNITHSSGLSAFMCSLSRGFRFLSTRLT